MTRSVRVGLTVVVLALGVLLLLPRRSVALSGEDQVEIQRAALLALFVTREHAKQLVFWNDAMHLSPTLQLLGESGVRVVPQLPDTSALALPLPVHVETLATMEQQFRTSPDAWETWFTRYPSSSGIIALTRPVPLATQKDGDEHVAVVVARTCGEHCHSAWRVVLQRTPTGVWRTRSVRPLALPRD